MAARVVDFILWDEATADEDLGTGLSETNFGRACSLGANLDDPEELYVGSGTNRLGGMYHGSQSHREPGADKEEPGNLLRKSLHGSPGRLYNMFPSMVIHGSQASPKGSDIEAHFWFLALLGEEIGHHLYSSWHDDPPFPEHALWGIGIWQGMNQAAPLTVWIYPG